MGSYLRGTGVTIEETVRVSGVLTNPATATFTIVGPDGTSTDYTYGIATEVTRPSVGMFRLDLDDADTPGVWRYEFVVTGPQGVSEGDFEIVDSLVSPASPPSPFGPTSGPCQPWVNGAEVAGCCDGTDADLLEGVAVVASEVLYAASGRQFAGVCTQTVRPCKRGCSCWGQATGLFRWDWAAGAVGSDFGGIWHNECGDRCGCGTLDRVKLPGYPVREILEVLVAGEEVDPAGYRLDDWRWLTRMDDPGPPSVKRSWPSCQNLALADTEPGTFSVTYRYGADPPRAGVLAASALACQLYKLCSGQVCHVPANVKRTTRQGVTVEMTALSEWIDPAKPSGIPAVDLFLRAFNPHGLTESPSIWSADLQPFARREGV